MKKRNFYQYIFVLILIVSGNAALSAQETTVLVNRAKEAIEKSDLDSALLDLNAALTIEPESEEALAQRARVFIIQKKIEPALAEAEKVLKLNSKNVIALNVRGLAKSDKKDYAGAIADFSQALAIDPKFYKAHRNRALAKIGNRENLDAVLKDYDAYLQFEPQNLNALQEAGNYCLNRNGSAQICAGYFDRYKKIKPDSMIGYLGYALAYGNVQHTIADKNFLKGEIAGNFRRAMELDPKNAIAPLNLGRLLLNLGDYDNSIVALTQAVALDAKSAWAYSMRGDNYRHQKDYDRAIADYTKALEINPKYQAVYTSRAKALTEKSDQEKYDYASETGRIHLTKILEDYLKAAELSNQKYETYEELSNFISAFSRITRGSRTESEANGAEREKKFKPLIAANPNNVCARYFLMQNKPYVKNESGWDEVLNKFDGKNGARCSSDAALWIGRFYAEGNLSAGISPNFEKAREFYRRALNFDPTASHINSWMAKLPSADSLVAAPRTSSNSGRVVSQELAGKLAREAEVNQLDSQYYNEIVAGSDRFNKYSKQKADTDPLDMTPELNAKLTNLMKQEMTAIIAAANKALSEIGNEISADQKSYYLRIIETGKATLAKISQ